MKIDIEDFECLLYCVGKFAVGCGCHGKSVRMVVRDQNTRSTLAHRSFRNRTDAKALRVYAPAGFAGGRPRSPHVQVGSHAHGGESLLNILTEILAYSIIKASDPYTKHATQRSSS